MGCILLCNWTRIFYIGIQNTVKTTLLSTTEYTDNIPQQLITNILKKKKPKQQNTSKYNQTTRSLSVVQWLHLFYQEQGQILKLILNNFK
jgi:hypothetical protein